MKSETKQMIKNPAHHYARLSLVSVALTAVLTTVHHYYKLGNAAFTLGVIIIGLPLVFLRWFRKTNATAPSILYALTNAWIIIGCGIVHGLWYSSIRIYCSN